MLHLIIGTDRQKARDALHVELKKIAPKAEVIRVSDANTLDDMRVALQGTGLFDRKRATVFEGIFANEAMRALFNYALERIATGDEPFFLLEEKLDAATKRRLEKHARHSLSFEAPKVEREDNFFALANALRAGSKKDLWVLLRRELHAGKAPEMLHGSLFWAAKQLVLKPRKTLDVERGEMLVARLAELPHEARRSGEELDCALERFVLSGL